MTPCRPGSASAALATACSPCAAGTHAEGEGNPACAGCAAGTHCPAGAAEATPCPGGAFSPDPALACAPCPAGEWASPADEGAAFCLICRRPAYCPGGGACRAGHAGVGCADCVADPPHYEFNDLCYPCASLGTQIVVGALLVFTCVALVWWNADRFIRLTKFSILLTDLQITLLFLDFRLAWPAALLRVRDAVSSAIKLLIGDWVAPECLAPGMGFLWKWAIAALVPLAVCGAVYALRQRASDERRRTKYTTTLTVLVVCLYVYGVGKAVVPWGCTAQPDGVSRLDANQGTECFTGAWWAALLLLSLPLTALYALGVPLYLYATLDRARAAETLYTRATIEVYGWIFLKVRLPSPASRAPFLASHTRPLLRSTTSSTGTGRSCSWRSAASS